MTICWAEGCSDDGTARFVAQPVALAGSQLKLGASRYVLCDEHWALVQHNMEGQ